jgi:hypothetical protein
MKQIVQIELTNHCNRRCSYCGQMNMTRPKGFITMDTIRRCVAVLAQLKQATVGLNHYGESLLHPQLIDIITELNANNVAPWLYTNGDLLLPRMKELASLRLHNLVISGHAPDQQRAELAKLCHALGLKAQVQKQVKPGALDIAGQISSPKQPIMADPAKHCKFLRDELLIVLWNGDLVPCCFDYDGKNVVGNINAPIGDALKFAAKPSALCGQCSGHPANIV